MEQHRFPRRSVSHGTLRASYSSHGGSALASPMRPLHKPLRSVNENSVLLHSPGALESMLKTTTETGDIGIFTIKPIPPSPRRPRGTLTEDGHLRPKPRRSVDDMYRRNYSLRLPSHQEVVPENFSVYGSDSLKSGTSTLSPNSTEGPGQRSCSMTTCGSRHLSHYKSTNTLQSQASGGSQLQRPRSPFPYPTRLKRPGIRPVSPAVTENGQVDYSRMVEINRISYVGTHTVSYLFDSKTKLTMCLENSPRPLQAWVHTDDEEAIPAGNENRREPIYPLISPPWAASSFPCPTSSAVNSDAFASIDDFMEHPFP